MEFRPENIELKETKRLALVLFPNYSLMPYVSLIEPLRLANRVLDKPYYEWWSYSLNGKPVISSLGLSTSVDGSISEMKDADITLICTGIDVEQSPDNPKLKSVLRKIESRGGGIGSVCTGSYVLAKYNLLNGYRCTIHWENLHAFRKEFPQVEVTSNVYEIDGNRYTCAGGTAALDMMLRQIETDLGTNVAKETAEVLMYQNVRPGHENQRFNLEDKLGITNAKVLNAIQIMQQHIEDPLSCTQLALTVDTSPRQLERLFQRYFNCTPGQYYLSMRLELARDLLKKTSQPIYEIIDSCGFASNSHFIRCYRDRFNCTPTQERKSLFTSRRRLKGNDLSL